jgi:hypothetical protein
VLFVLVICDRWEKSFAAHGLPFRHQQSVLQQARVRPKLFGFEMLSQANRNFKLKNAFANLFTQKQFFSPSPA